MLYFLIFILLMLLILSYYTLGRDIFQPSCIINAVWLVSAVSALINQHIWQYKYHLNTVAVIVGGLFTIYAVNFIFAYKKYKVVKSSSEECALKKIQVSSPVLILFLLIQLIALFSYYREIMRIAGSGSGINEIMALFRNAVSYGTEESVSFIANQLSNLSFAIAVVFSYIFINNIIQGRIKGNKRFLLPLLMYFAQVLMSGARGGIVYLIAGLIAEFGLIYYKKNRKSIKVTLKLVLTVLFIGLFVSVGFYILKSVVGRSTDLDFITYVARYLGGPIPLFDMFLQDPVVSDIWGKETFYSVLKWLRNLGLIDYKPYISHLEFRSYNGYSLGNVYGGVRRNIADFGIGGMFVLQAVFSAIMSYFYNRIKRTGSGKGIAFYSSIASCLFFHFYSDGFYGRVLTFGTVIIYIMILFVYWFVVDRPKVKEIKYYKKLSNIKAR